MIIMIIIILLLELLDVYNFLAISKEIIINALVHIARFKANEA